MVGSRNKARLLVFVLPLLDKICLRTQTQRVANQLYILEFFRLKSRRSPISAIGLQGRRRYALDIYISITLYNMGDVNLLSISSSPFYNIGLLALQNIPLPLPQNSRRAFPDTKPASAAATAPAPRISHSTFGPTTYSGDRDSRQ